MGHVTSVHQGLCFPRANTLGTNKEQKPYYNKQGAEAREGKANAVIYQL
jgi:hypothetical protein